MCLKIKSGPHIAKKDIRVYKGLHGTFNISIYTTRDLKKKRILEYFTPYFKSMKYYPNGHSSSKIKIENYDKTKIGPGLHAYVSPWNSFGERDNFRVIMYIPEGSTYYIGQDNDIVSNNLIWYPEKSMWSTNQNKYVDVEVWAKEKKCTLSKLVKRYL